VAHPSRFHLPAVSRFLLVAAVLALASACTGDNDPVGPRRQSPDPPSTATMELAFVSTRDGSAHIYVATANGSSVRRLTRGEEPAWSPDGKRIAFHVVSPVTGAFQIRVINVDGTGERVLTESGANAAWSPDGSRIAFNTVEGKPDAGIYVINSDGTGLRLLLGTEFEDPGAGDYPADPAWSPDGKRIAFVRKDISWSKPWQVYTMNADGSSPRLLTGAAADQKPTWSPDGMMIAFGSFRTIGTMNADGSGVRLYPSQLGFEPDWSPDGQSLIYSSFSSPTGDTISQVGSRMRVYVMDRDTGTARQLIPDAVAPTLPNYWDHQAAWWRNSSGAGSWDY
jgi:Tol biopolymer transport system component